MDTHHWTMDDADRAFGGPAALSEALTHLHATFLRLAPRHGGVALSFNDSGEPVVGPVVGQGPFLPGTHSEGEGRVFHGWLKGASAHARLHAAAGFDAARALWAIVEAFYPDLHPTDAPAFAVVGGTGNPKLVIVSGPLRTGATGSPWSEVDVRMALDQQIHTLWGAAQRASCSVQRFLTGHNATTLRAANVEDLHHVLHAVGHATTWAVQEPLRVDGIAKHLHTPPIGWSDTPKNERVRAIGSPLMKLTQHLHTHKPPISGFAVWYNGTSIQQSCAHKGGGRRGMPSPIAELAKRALRRLAETVPVFGPSGCLWGAQPRLVWTQHPSAQDWRAYAQSAGMVFDAGGVWFGDHTPTRLHHLDPWVQPPSNDPWWLAYDHKDGKRGQPRLFQAPCVDAATERCITACRMTLDQHNGWMPFHKRQLLLWPVARPNTPTTPPQDTTP